LYALFTVSPLTICPPPLAVVRHQGEDRQQHKREADAVEAPGNRHLQELLFTSSILASCHNRNSLRGRLFSSVSGDKNRTDLEEGVRDADEHGGHGPEQGPPRSSRHALGRGAPRRTRTSRAGHHEHAAQRDKAQRGGRRAKAAPTSLYSAGSNAWSAQSSSAAMVASDSVHCRARCPASLLPIPPPTLTTPEALPGQLFEQAGSRNRVANHFGEFMVMYYTIFAAWTCNVSLHLFYIFFGEAVSFCPSFFSFDYTLTLMCTGFMIFVWIINLKMIDKNVNYFIILISDHQPR
jgi:hypothetical protein